MGAVCTACLCAVFGLFALLFALTTGLSDVCRGGVDVGVRYLHNTGARLCADSLGGEGPAHACVVTPSASGMNVTLTLDLPAVSRVELPPVVCKGAPTIVHVQKLPPPRTHTRARSHAIHTLPLSGP